MTELFPFFFLSRFLSLCNPFDHISFHFISADHPFTLHAMHSTTFHPFILNGSLLIALLCTSVYHFINHDNSFPKSAAAISPNEQVFFQPSAERYKNSIFLYVKALEHRHSSETCLCFNS